MNRYKLTVNGGKPMPGVYVGDPCYILNDKFYQEFWGDENDFEDGELILQKGKKKYMKIKLS